MTFQPLPPPVAGKQRVAYQAAAGVALALVALSGALGLAREGDLVVDPSTKDWVLVVVVLAASWLAVFGVRALVTVSHEWIWHFCRAVGAGVVATASLKIYVLGIYFEHKGYWPAVAAAGAAAFALATLVLAARRRWVHRVCEGRVNGWMLASDEDAEARIELGLYVPSAFFESCCLLVRVGTDAGDAYRGARARLAVARVPVRALRPLVAQWGEVLSGVAGSDDRPRSEVGHPLVGTIPSGAIGGSILAQFDLTCWGRSTGVLAGTRDEPRQGPSRAA